MTFDAGVRAVEEAALRELGAMSNWGRWGPDDERGTLNLVTPEVTQRAAGLVRTGRVYPLGNPIRPGAPAHGPAPRPVHFMSMDGGDWAITPDADTPDQKPVTDGLLLPGLHATMTHLDALCHMWTGDRLYNGFNERVVRSGGAQRLGIENVAGVVTRGLLLDVARLHGVEHLAGDDLVTAGDLERAAEAAGVAIEAGDAVLVRTGWRAVHARDPERYSILQPGLGPSAGLLLARRDVAMAGADNTAVQAWGGFRNPVPGDPRAGLTDLLHIPFLRNLGIHLLEMLDLDALAADGVTEFMLCLAPLLIEGGTASPVNPLAVA
jgi:kynurenine formamidase